jgi:hypothetical protein
MAKKCRLCGGKLSAGRRLATGNKLTVICRSFPNPLFLLNIYFWHATCYLKTKQAKAAMTKKDQRANEQNDIGTLDRHSWDT